MTQEVLALTARIHPTYLSSLESGKRNPTVSVVEALAAALKVPLPQLFEDLSQ